jgi:hypothetical protein
MDVFKNTNTHMVLGSESRVSCILVLITDHNPNEVICAFRFVYIVMISSKQIVNKCGVMIVKEYGMYMIIILCYFVKKYIYSILKYL